jgi:hypothetical protein
MKNNIKTIAPIALIITVFVVACSREIVVRPTPDQRRPDITDSTSVKLDTLTGKEFIFQDLKWTHAGPGAIAEEEIWIGIENRPDLFNNPQRPMEVAVKFDTSSSWLNIPKWDGATTPSSIGFVHLIMYGNSFYVESYPTNFLLIGRNASLKIKFI